MRGLGTLLAVVFLLAGTAAADPAPGQATLKILTWNIQLLPATLAPFSGDLQKMQHERMPWIAEYLARQDYDVICLQEVLDPELTLLLADALRPAYPHIVMPQFDPQGKAFSNGVLFAARFPITYRAHIAYEHTAGIDTFASKGVTLVEGEKDGVKFQLAGTHMQAGHQDMKDHQYVEAADRILKPNRAPGVPQFFMGDFNTARGSGEYALFMSHIQMTDAPVDDPIGFSVDGENSWRPRNRKDDGDLIDYVLLWAGETGTKLNRLTIQRARREHEGKTLDLADHYGVVGEAVVCNK